MEKILLVDDFEMIRVAFKDYLEGQKDFQITKDVENGKEALNELKKSKFDLLMTDISMPEVDGLELIQEVNKKYPDMKVLVLTMYQDKDIISKCLEFNIHGYMAKNSERTKVIDCISKILNGEEYWDMDVDGMSEFKP